MDNNNSKSKLHYHKKCYNDTNRPIIVDVQWGKIQSEGCYSNEQSEGRIQSEGCYSNEQSEGRIQVSFLGEKSIYADAIIWPIGHKNWDWNLSDTHHDPGIQLSNVQELVIDYECNFVILSKGFDNILQTSNEAINWLETNKINYAILNSLDAIELYNDFSEIIIKKIKNKPNTILRLYNHKMNSVGILLHSTR